MQFFYQEEDTDLNTPVDPTAYESLKVTRNRIREKNATWIASFKRAHQRDPTAQDLEAIKEQIDDFNHYNKKYILMKAKMVRQGVLQPGFLAREAQVTSPRGQQLTKQRTTMTGFKFKPDDDKRNAFADPSLKKMREEIGHKEKQNEELEDEITRLRYMLQDNVGESEIVGGLQKELEIKEDQMKLRDDEIQDLIDAKKMIEDEKIQMQKAMDQMKTQSLL